MTRSYLKQILGLALWISLFLGSNVPLAEASITLPFSSTFNCVTQQQNDGVWVTCDGLAPGGGQWSSGQFGIGTPCQITTAANYSGGGGGRGSRNWFGPGKNANCGEPSFGLSGSLNLREAWIRWYQRLEAGWYWQHGGEGQKNIYLATCRDDVTGAALSYGWNCPQPNNEIGFWWEMKNGQFRVVNAGLGTQVNVIDESWRTFYGGGTDVSTGAWVCNEVHWKSETTDGGNDGVAEWWLNGTRILYGTNMQYGMGASGVGPSGWAMPSNMTNTDSVTRYQDVDDVVVSSTGRIGCLGNADGIPPIAPTNLQVH